MIDHDGVDLYPQILFDVTACRANHPQRRDANHSDIDVVGKEAGLADKAACPRAVDKRIVHILYTGQSVTETSQHADSLEQYGAEFRGPRQIPIGADEPVAAQQSGDQEPVFFKARHFSARRGLCHARPFGDCPDGEFVSRTGEKNPEYPKLLV